MEAFEKLSGDELDAVLATASVESFQSLAVVPLILLPIFAFIWLWDRRQAASKSEAAVSVGNP